MLSSSSASNLRQPYNSAMTRPSKAAQAFPIVFGLIFMAFGLAFSSSFLLRRSRPRPVESLGGSARQSFFALIGGGIVYFEVRQPPIKGAEWQPNSPIPDPLGSGGKTGQPAGRKARTATAPSACGSRRFFANTIVLTLRSRPYPNSGARPTPKSSSCPFHFVGWRLLAGAAAG